MKSRFTVLLLTLSACSIFATSANAHTFGLHGGGLGDGITHPLLGIDHLLAMVAVGIWAAQLGGRLTLILPAVFLTFMASAAAFASTGWDFPMIEPAIAATVLALGLFIAFAVRISAPLGIALIGIFALCHGYAHGLELPVADSPWLYGFGFVTATAALHCAGILFGISARRSEFFTRFCGYGIALTGVYLLSAV